jgi:hypothetical protein
MTTDENQERRPISKGLRERMQDCQMELVDDSAPQLLHRVGPMDWEVPGTDCTLTYCQVNCWFVAYQGGKPLFTAQTLEEAEQELQSLIKTPSGT